jgi:hypothetical protein
VQVGHLDSKTTLDIYAPVQKRVSRTKRECVLGQLDEVGVLECEDDAVEVELEHEARLPRGRSRIGIA